MHFCLMAGKVEAFVFMDELDHFNKTHPKQGFMTSFSSNIQLVVKDSSFVSHMHF